jgi:hypothetical protein
MDRDVTCFLVDRQLDGGGVELEERRRAAQRVALLGILARPSPRALISPPIGPRARWTSSAVGASAPPANSSSRARTWRAADTTALPISTVEREAEVCWS